MFLKGEILESAPFLKEISAEIPFIWTIHQYRLRKNLIGCVEIIIGCFDFNTTY